MNQALCHKSRLLVIRITGRWKLANGSSQRGRVLIWKVLTALESYLGDHQRPDQIMAETVFQFLKGPEFVSRRVFRRAALVLN